jgi:hypothetical protein
MIKFSPKERILNDGNIPIGGIFFPQVENKEE